MYGVGIKELLLVIDRPKNVLLYSLKTFLTTTFSVMLSWVVTTYILAEKNQSVGGIFNSSKISNLDKEIDKRGGKDAIIAKAKEKLYKIFL